MRCPNCGKELPDNVKFCSDCGTEFSRRQQSDYDTTQSGQGSTIIDDSILFDPPDQNDKPEPTDPYIPGGDFGNGDGSGGRRRRRRQPGPGGGGGSYNDRNRLYIYLGIALGLVIIAIIGITAKLLMDSGDEGKTETSTEITTTSTIGGGSDSSTDTEPGPGPDPTTITEPEPEPIIPAGSLDSAEDFQPLEYNGHAYAIYNFRELGLSNFNKCERYCEKMGGHLAVIDSEGENQAIYSYLLKNDRDHTFFGFSDQNNEGLWEWVDGSPIYYTNWASGQPNNKGGREHFAQFNGKDGGTWNDAGFGDQSHRFLCEWE